MKGIARNIRPLSLRVRAGNFTFYSRCSLCADNQTLDQDNILDNLSAGLDRQKTQAQAMGSEINRQQVLLRE